MSIIFSILLAVILFSFLIFVHELGHFVAAKLSGVQVNEFSMFMGPAIVRWRRGTTQYTIRCIPIGGYCAMEGEDEDSENPHAFQNVAWWKRLIILAAGSVMNFVAGVLIVTVVLFWQPRYVTTELANVEPWSSVAVENGLQAGDQIMELNGKKIRIYDDFQMEAMMLADGHYDMTVRRNGQIIQLEDVPWVRNSQTHLFGVNFAVAETNGASVPERILPTAISHVRSVIVGLQMLLTGQAGFQDMTGVVGIVHIMSEGAAAVPQVSYAILQMLSIGGFLAINLAVMNILPIPALDGGRIVGLLLTTAIETVTRKKIDPKYEGYIHTVGMLLLLLLMAAITFKDIFTIFKR